MTKVCKICNLPVFGGGYCKHHQYHREDIKKNIAPRSKKRAKQEREYTEIEQGGVCFFCSQIIPGRADKHHLKGRIGYLLTDKKYLVPAHRECHMDYHNMPIRELMRKTWWLSFLQKLKRIDIKLYYKELNKIDK